MLLVFLLSLSILAADSNSTAEMLSKASSLGDLETVQSYLEAGVNPGLPDRYGETPLYHAVSFNQIQAAELLLAHHADPNQQPVGRRGNISATETPLQSAADLGNVPMASILVNAGARVNAKTPAGRTALHFALGRLAMVQFLIEKGADVNARDAEGTSPLDNAVWYGSLDDVAVLLAHGARLNEAEPRTGATPINEAAFRGQTKLVRYLLQFHPDLAVADKQGYTPLQNAIRRGKEDSALLLFAAEPKERQTPPFLQKAMDAALRKDESSLVECLLQHGASPNGALPSGATPLDAAAFTGSGKLVQLLLDNKADPNSIGRNGTSPLEDASLKGFDNVAALLLDHGAQANYLNPASGTTALYSAASFGKTAVVKLLLQRGADPSLCGHNRKTPYQTALENGYRDLANEIQNHGGAKSCNR